MTNALSTYGKPKSASTRHFGLLKVSNSGRYARVIHQPVITKYRYSMLLRKAFHTLKLTEPFALSCHSQSISSIIRARQEESVYL